MDCPKNVRSVGLTPHVRKAVANCTLPGAAPSLSVIGSAPTATLEASLHLGTEREFKLTLVALIAVSITMLIVPYAKTAPVRLDGSLAVVVPFDDGAVVAADSRTVVSDKLACDETYKNSVGTG